MSCDLRLGSSLDADGLASLPNRSVASVISDPPWCERAHWGALVRPRTRGAAGGALPFLPLPADAMPRLAAQFARVVRRWVMLLVGEAQVGDWIDALEAVGLRFVRLGAAVRTNPTPRFDGKAPAPAFDPIVICHSPTTAMSWNGHGKPARWNSPAARFDEGGQVHVCQKPLSLMRALVEDFTDPAELVLDPFAGAGTTAVACKELGRRFVGWELSPQYHATALRRLETTREQLRLAPVSAGGQLDLVGDAP